MRIPFGVMKFFNSTNLSMETRVYDNRDLVISIPREVNRLLDDIKQSQFGHIRAYCVSFLQTPPSSSSFGCATKEFKNTQLEVAWNKL